MALHSLKIYTNDLELGMFVSSLDRPWLETPFLLQGFLIETRDEIERLRQHCEFVYVDSRKSRMGCGKVENKVRTAPRERRSDSERARVSVAHIFEGRPLRPYQDDTDWDEEHPQAYPVLDSLVEDIGDIFDHVSDGGSLNVIRLKKSVKPVVESMSRNPDACLWLARLKEHDQYAYQHSLSASIWAVAMGRQLGLPRQDLQSLAVGGMLMDVGKLRLDPELLQAARPLTEDEGELVREHVNHGLQIIEESGILNPDVIDIVAHHHERWDGSGYPQGLKGEQIPAVARIAAIVDTYDAITSTRSHAQAISPADAIRMLYKSRNTEFQTELVEAFIQAVGIYPAGTLVELSSGEVGMVVSEYRTRRLRPKVMVLLDAGKDPLHEPKLLDLLDSIDDEGVQQLNIVKSLEPGTYEVDLSKITL